MRRIALALALLILLCSCTLSAGDPDLLSVEFVLHSSQVQPFYVRFVIHQEDSRYGATPLIYFNATVYPPYVLADGWIR